MLTIYNIVLPRTCLDLSTKPKRRINSLNGKYIIQDITEPSVIPESLRINREWHKKRYGFYLSESEIKIFLMHRLAWEYLLHSPSDYCVVVEGCHLSLEKPIPKLMELNLSLEDWDLLFPFTEGDVLGTKDQLEGITLKNYNAREEKEVEPYLLGRRWGSFFYFISRKGAKKLLMIKEVIQNIDDEMLLLAYEGKLDIYCQKFTFFNYVNRPRVLNLDREEEIYLAIMNNNVWEGDSIRMARELLKIVSTLAGRLRIDLILEGGTLLGHVQHGCLMAWDDDIDIGIYYRDINKLLLAINGVVNMRMERFIEERTGKGFYKIWSSNGIKIDRKRYTFPFIDLWPYEISGHDIQFLNGVVCTNAAREKFIEVSFEGSKVKIPYNASQCLDERYKTWRNMIRVYPWSHQLERNEFYPLTVNIETDRNGRMIAPLCRLLG